MIDGRYSWQEIGKDEESMSAKAAWVGVGRIKMAFEAVSSRATLNILYIGMGRHSFIMRFTAEIDCMRAPMLAVRSSRPFRSPPLK